MADGSFGKNFRLTKITVSQIYNFRTLAWKVKLYFAPFIVLVAIPMYSFVLVSGEGDFFVFLS